VTGNGEDGPPDMAAKRAALPDEPTPENAKIVAYGGSREDPEAYMVVPAEADPENLSEEFCWLLDGVTGQLRGPMPVMQATKFNPYERYDTPPADADELIAAARTPEDE